MTMTPEPCSVPGCTEPAAGTLGAFAYCQNHREARLAVYRQSIADRERQQSQ